MSDCAQPMAHDLLVLSRPLDLLMHLVPARTLSHPRTLSKFANHRNLSASHSLYIVHSFELSDMIYIMLECIFHSGFSLVVPQERFMVRQDQVLCGAVRLYGFSFVRVPNCI